MSHNGDEKYVSELLLRRISEEIDWNRQLELFGELCGAAPAESASKTRRRSSRKRMLQAR